MIVATFKFVDIGTVIVLGIGDGGFQHLLDNRRALLWREGKDIQGVIDLLAANQVRNEAAFLCGEAYTKQISGDVACPQLLISSQARRPSCRPDGL